MDRLDPARTALMLVHMGKGVAGEVDRARSRGDVPQDNAG
jgi:hypothetical protein